MTQKQFPSIRTIYPANAIHAPWGVQKGKNQNHILEASVLPGMGTNSFVALIRFQH